MSSTTSKFTFTCWYRGSNGFKKEKALLLDISNGYVTLLLESGRFVVDHIEYATLDDAAGVFEQCEWTDGEGDA